jgi:hypothetical protein
MGEIVQFKSADDPKLREYLLREVTTALTERGRLDNIATEVISSRVDAAMQFIDSALTRPMLRSQEPLAVAVSEDDAAKIQASHLDLSLIIVGSLLRHFIDALPNIVAGKSRS